jgi:hypothetical protein
MLTEIEKLLYEFSDKTKSVTSLTSVALLFIIIAFFSPIMHYVVKFILNLIAIALLTVAFILNFRTTNYTTQHITHLFVDPSLSHIKKNIILNYVFSFVILILIGYILMSYF